MPPHDPPGAIPPPQGACKAVGVERPSSWGGGGGPCLLGAQGAARRWQARGWVGSAGPVSNIPLWKELLQLLDSTFQDILWVKVPSHVNVEGNEQADTLANNGRLSNPLYPARKTPRVQAAGQRAKRARQVAARSPPPPPGVCPPRAQSY